MAQYQIASRSTVLGPFASTVSDEDLEGCNIAALVAAGHLVPVVKPTPASAGKPKE